MFARKVTACLKPNSLLEFAKLMEHEILPWLRKQDGFLDLITLSASDGREITTISFWEHQGSALSYNSTGYPQVLKVFGELLDGVPYVKTFDVINSTLQSVAPPNWLKAEASGKAAQSNQSDYVSCETTA